jgi:hypothetical protein
MTPILANDSIRSQILQALDMLISETSIAEANTALRHLRAEFTGRETAFSLNRIIFSGFVSAALDSEYQSHKQMLIELREELIGSRPNWKTYALKFNFAGMFTPTLLEAFNKIQEFIPLLEDKTGQIEHEPRFKMLHQHLHKFIYEKLIPQNAGELLLSLLIHAALVLPVWRLSQRDTFDVAAYDGGSFSLILPPETMPDTYNRHIQYMQALISKLNGEDIVFVDVNIIGDLITLNTR